MKKSTGSSTKRDAFIDTSGFYAILVKDDPLHAKANEILAHAKRRTIRFVTTDYILDETATLLTSRRRGHLVAGLFDRVLASKACRVEWMDPVRFDETRQFFLKHHDQPWSFTDCFSFCVMNALGLRGALTGDVHFRHAGFQALLVG